MARYSMRLKSVGNPDFGQHAPVSDPKTVEGETLGEMRTALEAYIEEWNLGGGNLPSVAVKEGKKAVGYFSYNGRLWDRNLNSLESAEKAKEIAVG
jgi:hypothetical protein